MTEQFANLAQSTLFGNVSAGTTTLRVVSSASFPTTGNFRVIVDSEIFIVTAVSGNVLTAIPGSEGTTPASHLSGVSVTHILTAGVMKQLTNSATIGCSIDFQAWLGSPTMPSGDITTLAQNFILYCQLVAISLGAANLSDQLQRKFIRAHFGPGNWYISCPMIAVEFVSIWMDGGFVRVGTGTPKSEIFYNGDTTSQACGNLFQPTVIVVPRGHLEPTNVYGNSNGSDAGSGVILGRTWSIYAAAIESPGSGYSVGQTFFSANPSLSPYTGAQVTVAGVNGSGGVTSITLVPNETVNGVGICGAYGLPPVLQQQQWTTANGFNVFDANGNYKTSGGTATGTGCTLGLTWMPDFAKSVTGFAGYFGGIGGLITDTIIGKLRISSFGGLANDSTYGSMFGLAVQNENYTVDEIQMNGSVGTGLLLSYCSDLRCNILNVVNMTLPIVVGNSSNIICKKVVIDTPDYFALSIDNCVGIDFEGKIFNRGIGNYPGGAPATIQFGLYSSSGNMNTNISLKFNMTVAGAAGNPLIDGGAAAVFLDYTQSSRIELTIGNNEPGYQNPGFINSVVTYGSHNGNGNVIDATIDYYDNASAPILPIYTGTYPAGSGLRVFDSLVNGYCGPYGIYEIYGSGAPTNGTSGTGAGRCAPTSKYIDVSGGNIYFNTGTQASPTWTLFTP